MRVLQVNKFHWLKGGSETAYFGITKLLEAHGHEVIPFSMKDDKNLPTPWSRFFVENVDYGNGGLKNKLSCALKIIYSFDAASKMKRLLQEVRPDVAHFHIFQHQISPSVFGPLRKKGVPIILTLHDLKPVCPNYRMYTGGKLCEKCSGGRFYNCLLNRCTKGSAFGSLINTIEMYLHYALRYYQNVDRYITVSSFYRDKMIEAGFPPEKVVHIPNFIDASEFQSNGADKGYGLYFGRLSDEKGLLTLLKALKLCPEIPFYIAGSGPQEKELKEFAGMTGLRNATFLGFKKGEDLKKLVQEASFTVIPSEWYENCPMSVIESLALGTPVIGSRIGGIPELVRDGVTGFTFTPGDSKDLSAKIKNFAANPMLIENYGKNARKIAEKEYNPATHYSGLMKIYETAIRKNKRN